MSEDVAKSSGNTVDSRYGIWLGGCPYLVSEGTKATLELVWTQYCDPAHVD